VTTPAPTVAAILVTYGDRWHLLRRVLGELLQHHESLRHVIVVDNASRGIRVDDLDTRSAGPEVIVVRLPENLGSAAGFKAGLEAAHDQTEADLFWLLDDDNLPESGGLEALLQTFAQLGNDPLNSMLAMRPNRREYVSAAHGQGTVAIAMNSFMGLHLNKIAARLARRSPMRPQAPTKVGYAPYGGLLLHRSWIARVGLPDESYFVYADDFEFTSRIVAAGGRIVLCPSSQIKDLETSWHLGGARRFHWMAPETDPGRVYYSMRNRVALERRRFVSSTPLYLVNAATFVTLRLVPGVAYHLAISRCPGRVWRRVRLLIRAVRDGWTGRLGRVDASAF